MNTLITPAQAVASAFTDGEYLAPEAIGEGDIAAAEQRYIVPVIGRAFHEKLLAGLHAGFTAEYLAAPVALFTRIAVQPRLDIRTGQCGTVAPKSGSYQPADAQSLRELQRQPAPPGPHAPAPRCGIPRSTCRGISRIRSR